MSYFRAENAVFQEYIKHIYKSGWMEFRLHPSFLSAKRPVIKYSENGTHQNSCKHSFDFYVVLKALYSTLGKRILWVSFKKSIF